MKTASQSPSNNLDRTPATPGVKAADSSSLTEASLPRANRRNFLRNLSVECATAVGTVYLTHSILGKMRIPSRIDPATEEKEQQKERRYPNTNEVTKFPSGASFHNLGVMHLGLRFMLDRETVLKAIKASQIVMVEGYAGQEYFDFLAALAHEHQKTVVRLESGKSLLHGQAYWASTTCSSLAAGYNIFDYVRRAASWGARKVCSALPATNKRRTSKQSDVETGAEEKAEGLRNLRDNHRGPPSIIQSLVTAAVSANQAAFGISPYVCGFEEGGDFYPQKDRSYTMDGRTVLMLKDIEHLVEFFRGVRVLVITGDLHATGFKYYTSSLKNYELFKNKVAFYESIYRSWLGGRPRPEMDPALKGEETPYGT